jgi:GH35 family endo-1,4-beta-xylanase
MGNEKQPLDSSHRHSRHCHRFLAGTLSVLLAGLALGSLWMMIAPSPVTARPADRIWRQIGPNSSPAGLISRTGWAPIVESAAVTVTGTVADVEGQPPAAAVIAAVEPISYTLVVLTLADATGHYTLTVLAEATYWLIAFPFSGTQVNGYGLHGMFPRGDRITVESTPLQHNFILDPCYELILEGYDADGSLVPNTDLSRSRFTAGLTDSVARGVFSEVQRESEPAIPSVCLPPGEPRRVFLQWTVPGFGRVMLGADNGGTGFQGPAGEGTVLNLNYELARTQVGRLRSNYNRYVDAGYTISPTFAARLAQAEAELDEAATRSGAGRAAWADRALSTSLWALEDLELARARQDIARYRQGDLTITVVDAAGRPVPGATVAYTQTTHDFLFGVFDPMVSAGEEAYRLMRAAGVNYVTSGFYWIDIEPEEGQIRWNYIDHDVGVLDLTTMGFRQKAHPLIWLMDLAMPDYLKAKSFPELNATVDAHVRALVDRYHEQIGIWEVINEAHAAWASGNLTREEVTALTRTGVHAIRETDLTARISINAAFDWFGESRYATYLLQPEDTFTIPVWDYFDRLIAEGVDFDIVGQQLYDGGASFVFQQAGIGSPLYAPTWDLAHLSAVMDRLQTYGKPVHLTEQSVSGTWDDSWTDAGWWHSPWDPETQAEFLTAYYTIGFSKPRNEAITWWNVTDRDSFFLAGGLLDENNIPKPAYYALRDFIAGHTTTGAETTDATGQLRIRGYGGNYDVAVSYDPVTETATMRVTEQQADRSTVVLNLHRVFLPAMMRGTAP